MSENLFVTHLKPNFMWMKRNARHQREEPNPPYVNVYSNAEKGAIIAEPVSGGDVTGKSYKMKAGKVDVPGLGEGMGVELYSGFPIPFTTSYNREEDLFHIDINQPVLSKSPKKNIVKYIKDTENVDSPRTRLSKDALKTILEVETDCELVDELKNVLDDDDSTQSITVNVNKSGYVKLAQVVTDKKS